MPSFMIPSHAFDGFLDLIEMGPEKIERLSREAASRPLTLNLDSLVADLAAQTEFDEERIDRAIESVVIPLSSLRAEFHMTPEEFLGLVTEQIEHQNADWHEEHQSGWEAINSSLAGLLNPDGFFGQLSKAYRLLADRPTRARGLSVLTELRPVYDEGVTRKTAMLLTQTLVIDYTDGLRRSRLHLTLDQQDIRDLREQLNRADKKAQLLEAEGGVPLLIPGSEQK